MDFRGVQVHADCGAEVLAFGTLGGGSLLIEQLMVPGPAGLEMAIHYCRDYVAWHQPADPRHPDEMPWPAETPAAAAPPAREVRRAA